MDLMRNIVIAVLGWAIGAGPLHAGLYDGNLIHEMCQDSGGAIYGYVGGWVDKQNMDVVLLQETNLDPGIFNALGGNVCMPNGMTTSQAVDVICNYLRDKPDSRNKPGGILMLSAMYQAWPCP